MACGLDYHYMHPQAQPEVGYLILPGVSGGSYHSLYPPHAEAAGDDYPLGGAEQGIGAVSFQFLGVDPDEVQASVLVKGGVAQRLADGEIGVLHSSTYLPTRAMFTGFRGFLMRRAMSCHWLRSPGLFSK